MINVLQNIKNVRPIKKTSHNEKHAKTKTAAVIKKKFKKFYRPNTYSAGYTITISHAIYVVIYLI